MKLCSICKKPMDVPNKIETADCGGDCMLCMAVVGGDPGCIDALKKAGVKL